MLGLYNLTSEEEKTVKKVFKTVCRIHGIKKSSISADITIVDAREIHQLNLTTRQVDKPTDVLSYPALDNIIFPFSKSNYQDILSPEDNTLYIGEIIICREIMLEQAEEYGHSEDRTEV